MAATRRADYQQQLREKPWLGELAMTYAEHVMKKDVSSQLRSQIIEEVINNRATNSENASFEAAILASARHKRFNLQQIIRDNKREVKDARVMNLRDQALANPALMTLAREYYTDILGGDDSTFRSDAEFAEALAKSVAPYTRSLYLEDVLRILAWAQGRSLKTVVPSNGGGSAQPPLDGGGSVLPQVVPTPAKKGTRNKGSSGVPTDIFNGDNDDLFVEVYTKRFAQSDKERRKYLLDAHKSERGVLPDPGPDNAMRTAIINQIKQFTLDRYPSAKPGNILANLKAMLKSPNRSAASEQPFIPKQPFTPSSEQLFIPQPDNPAEKMKGKPSEQLFPQPDNTFDQNPLPSAKNKRETKLVGNPGQNVQSDDDDDDDVEISGGATVTVSPQSGEIFHRPYPYYDREGTLVNSAVWAYNRLEKVVKDDKKLWKER